MTTCEEIVSLLDSSGESNSFVGDRAVVAALQISRPTPDQDAQPGHVSWISKRVLQRAPERLDRFSGSMLLCPSEARPKERTSCLFVLCHNPRRAIIRVIREFFTDLADTGIPSAGQPAISKSATIGANVRLSHGVVIGDGCTIGDGCQIGPNSVIARSCLHNDVSIAANCSIGFSGFGYEQEEGGKWQQFPHIGGVAIEQGVEIGSNVCIDRGTFGNTVIRRDARIDNQVHIAHNVEVGRNTLVIANSMIGGSVVIGNDVWVAPSTSIKNGIVVEENATVGMGAVVIRPVKAGDTVVGNPGRILRSKHRSD